jgi:O-antigen ligase
MIIREVSIIASMIVLYNSVKNMGLYSYFYGAIFFFAILNFVLLIGGYFFDFIEIYENNRFVGTMNNSNAISIALNYCVFISVILLNDTKNFRKILFLNFIIFISLYMIVMTVSRKGFLAGSLLFVLYLNSISNSKIKILSVLMSLVLIFYFSFSFLKFEEFETASDFLFDRMEGAADFEGQDVDASTEKRINLIESGWNMFLEKPVLGWGINTFVVFHDGYYAHNNFIELLFGVGMIGAIIYYFIYLSLYKKAFYLLNGRERQYFIIIFTFFLFMDVILVSYYFRLYFMFVSFLLAYMKKNEGINS